MDTHKNVKIEKYYGSVRCADDSADDYGGRGGGGRDDNNDDDLTVDLSASRASIAVACACDYATAYRRWCVCVCC